MRSNPGCPVCGADLIYHRRNKEALKITIKEGNSIIIDENKSDTSTEVYCSKDRTHEIGSITNSRVKQIIGCFGF